MEAGVRAREALFKWWLRRQSNDEYEQVMLWPQMTPQEQLSLWTTMMFQTFEKAWEKQYGEKE